MAACVLCRPVRRLCYLPGLRKDFIQAQHVSVKRVDETDDQGGKKGVFQHQEASLPEEYRLHYNPSSYHHSLWNKAISQSQTDNDEDKCLSTLAPSFWKQNSRFSASCLRHLSSSKNTHLDLAFSKGPKREMPSDSPYHRKPIEPDVPVDTRAFLKCRPEYASKSLNLTNRPCSIEWLEAWLLLQKVSVLKGSMKPSDVSQFLMELSCLHPDKISLLKSDQRFTMLLRYSVENLRLFTTVQLLDVMQSFVWLEIPPSHSVLGLYEAELCRRADEMSLHQLLLAADLWRCMRRQVPEFLQHLFNSIPLYLGQMGVPELVQLLYIVGEGRQFPKDLIRPVKKLLMCNLQQLYPEEVGTICLGLFKSQTSISEGAVIHIVDKAHSFVEEMSDFAMVNVLKYMRFRYLYHRDWLEAMAVEVPRRAQSMGIKGLMHVALTCSALHYYNDKILIAIAERVPSLVPYCRVKDSCKLLWAFGTLMFLPVQSPNLYSSLTDSLRQRKVEFGRYPEQLLTGLLGLAFVSQFPEDLIALALSPEFVNIALNFTQLELKKDLFTLERAVALELPQWTGPWLSSELREEVTEMLWKFAQSDVCQKPEIQEAESILQDMLGGEMFVHKRMILPHTRSVDLEVHLDSKGKPIALNPASNTATLSPKNSSSRSPSHRKRRIVQVNISDDLFSQLIPTKNTTEPLTSSPKVKPTSLHKVERDWWRLSETGVDLTTEITDALIKPSVLQSKPQVSKGIVKLAIQVSSRNHYCCNSQQLLGLHAMKRRHLKLAGYRVVEVSHQEWFPMLRKSRAEKHAYLRDKVYKSLE
ncbi:FAST kinase domain-containing protein 5, mitochondrial [Dicentrarchus labrax]|uniref:RAP domain-containing protein n=1 Tax=Dicentrarchus labrax TaxID=13489 RepID=A0A8C4NZZ7_DICLA|nr:FAST kinase domain-containing protein 5, mitochondrial [Dicentrarchus labrax]